MQNRIVTLSNIRLTFINHTTTFENVRYKFRNLGNVHKGFGQIYNKEVPKTFKLLREKQK